jgi:Putative Ig domain
VTSPINTPTIHLRWLPTRRPPRNYVGSIAVATLPKFAGPTPDQATPRSVIMAAMSFVGQVCNMSGCWPLVSNISAEAGASLPITSTMLNTRGLASGEWIVAYNGPAGQTGNWQSQITAGEIVMFSTSSGSGHITTVVSGSGSSAMVVDNMAFEDQNGHITNSANDGAWDVIISQPHDANYEWSVAAPGSVVVYELDCPTIKVVTPTSRVAVGGSIQLGPLFIASNPLASQAITEYQFYDSGTGGAANDSFLVNGSNVFANSAANAVTVNAADLSSLSLQAGNTAGTDTIAVRAFNGSYWGDWRKFTVNLAAQGPVVSAQTSTQTWQEGQAVNFALAANTFTEPQGQTLTYSANLSNGGALPSWLQFDASTQTFTGMVPDIVAALSIVVRATNTSGLTTSETFAVQTPPPAPPMVTNQTGTQCCAGGEVNFTLAADTFTDPSGGDVGLRGDPFQWGAAAVLVEFRCSDRDVQWPHAGRHEGAGHQRDRNRQAFAQRVRNLCAVDHAGSKPVRPGDCGNDVRHELEHRVADLHADAAKSFNEPGHARTLIGCGSLAKAAFCICRGW